MHYARSVTPTISQLIHMGLEAVLFKLATRLVLLRNYCGKSKFKSTLHWFANSDDHHKELITTWFEIYTTYDDAMSNVLRKFKTEYYVSTKTNYTSKTVPDLSSLFAQAQLQKSITKNETEFGQ
ncbi:hypothetical protein BDF20DRAFT_991690 [Mycotypha africana]|uniref:uncharacterized protein n=1 Tax=Mycotypha africana TaxID=64632 RepID=UPI002301C714|nr:uncharacterized protein BDF20DRAFT_991690 [Mycotypha africana]KAI8967696.1 hypothetical protein BDF20DRAFT_991690 [Mycotypha africana]